MADVTNASETRLGIVTTLDQSARTTGWLARHAEQHAVESSVDVDLHRESRESARLLILKAFCEAFAERRQRIIVNHGRGTGAMRDLVHRQSEQLCREALKPTLGKGFLLEITVEEWPLDANWAIIEFHARRKTA